MVSERRLLEVADRPDSCPYRLSFSRLNMTSPSSSRSSYNLDQYYVSPNSARYLHAGRYVPSTTPVVSMRNSAPVMLLPKVEARLPQSWSRFSKDIRSDVVPTDPRFCYGLTHNGYSIDDIKNPNDNKQLILHALTYILSTFTEGYKFIKTDGLEYLDSFGEVKDIPTVKRSAKSADLNEGFYVGLLRKLGVVVDLRCAECAKVLQKFGGCRGFFLWFLKQLDQRKEYDLLQKTDTLLRSIQPHFCNFVRKIELQPRPQDVPPVRHAFGGSDGEDELDGLESASSASSLSDRKGTLGRPSTPQHTKTGFNRHCVRPRTTVRPRSAVMGKKKKSTAAKAKSKPKPAAPKQTAGWAEKVFNLDAPEKPSNVKVKVPAPPKKKKEVSIKSASSTSVSTVDSPRRIVKKTLKSGDGATAPEAGETEPATEEQTVTPSVEMVETPATPETEPQQESPPVSAVENASVRPPPSPNLLDRSRSPRSPKPGGQQRGTLPDIGLRKDSGDGESDLRAAMKQTESAMNDAALKKFIQSSSHAVNHAGRLALSKQSSRFELPMDMMSLETLTPQEYLRKYCVVSSRRQSLYHKMFIKNKEPKKQSLHVKELVKALKDVLTDTLDDAMVNLVLEMNDITEETEIDLKLFSGLAALAERMLYAKFVTEDTEGMADHQKERIECADFFALDWKFHGVKVNAPMERLLRSL